MSTPRIIAAPTYALAGVLLGTLGPIAAMLIRWLQGADPMALQRTDPLMWIIDSAPLVLGVFAYLFGREQARLHDANRLLLERASDFEAAASALEATLRHAGHHGEELSRVRAELHRLAKVAAHDLAAPLVGIRNLAEWIREEVDPDHSGQALSHLDKLEQRVERMQRLVRRLEEYASAGRTRHAVEAVDVNKLVQKIFSRVHGSVRFKLVTQDLPTMHTARPPLGAVFRALIDNAIQHHDLAEGTITVSCRLSSPFYEFRVGDDGPGVPERFRERIFDLFETLERRDQKEASGAGLAIAKKIVEAYGCRIEVAPREGRGTEVVFSWPLTLDDEPSELNTVVKQSIALVLDKRRTLAGEPPPK